MFRWKRDGNEVCKVNHVRESKFVDRLYVDELRYVVGSVCFGLLSLTIMMLKTTSTRQRVVSKAIKFNTFKRPSYANKQKNVKLKKRSQQQPFNSI